MIETKYSKTLLRNYNKVCYYYYPIFYQLIATMDLSTASDFASETGSPFISEDLPELQISYPDTKSHNLRPASV